jgi:uncharacterized protein (TIGR02145 family)
VSPSTESSVSDPIYYVHSYEGTSVSDAKATDNYDTYGVLYNWPAAMAACPSGWHLPSDDEWTTLATFLGGATVAGGKMKETGTAHWLAPNVGATNESCFTALGGSMRQFNGFLLIGGAVFWTSLENGPDIWCIFLVGYTDRMDKGYVNRYNGLSVRCVKN